MRRHRMALMRGAHGTTGLWAALIAAGACSTDEIQAPETERAPRVGIQAAVVPTTGLIGEWKLDETGGTNAVDTRSGYNGTVMGGAAFVAGKLGNGLNLNNGTAGTGSKFVQLPTNATLDAVQEANYTISAWFFPYSLPPATTNANQRWSVITKAPFQMGLVYNPDGGFEARHYLTGDVLRSTSSANSYPLNAWHHVAGVVSKTAGTVTLYVNGSSAGSVTFTAGTAAREYGTAQFGIGKGGSNWAANGKVDQVRIYNRALTGAEVSGLFTETVGTGRPYGVIAGPHWASNATLEPNMEPFTLSQQGVDPGNGSTTGIVERMTAAKNLGVKLVLIMTGGEHETYMTDFDGTGPGESRFDRSKWTQRQQLFNTGSIKTAVANRISDGTVVAADVMDEPYNDGGPAESGNTWGPTGTMVKNGTSTYDTYRVTVAAGAPAGQTFITVTSLYKALPNGTRLTFLPGLGKTAVLTAAASQGATRLTVAALPKALVAGDAAHSNSIDNMVAEVKNIFPTLAVGVSHQHDLFWPAQRYAVSDFITDQYSAIRGNVTTYRDNAVAMGAAHGHKVVFSINLLNGGARVAGCTPGTFGENCRMTPAEVEHFASVLAPAGPGFLMWRYDATMFANSNYKAKFQGIAADQAVLGPMSWYR